VIDSIIYQGSMNGQISAWPTSFGLCYLGSHVHNVIHL